MGAVFVGLLLAAALWRPGLITTAPTFSAPTTAVLTTSRPFISVLPSSALLERDATQGHHAHGHHAHGDSERSHSKRGHSVERRRNAKAPPNFYRMTDCHLHHLWKIDPGKIKEITERVPPPFKMTQYRKVMDVIKLITEHVRSEAKSSKMADCVDLLDKLFGGGKISWDQRCAVIADFGGDMEELKLQAFLQAKNPTFIRRKRPDESRQSKNARALREAEKKARERREAEEQSRQQNHVSTSSRMTEPIETPCKNKEKNTLQKEACEQDS